MNGRNWGRMSNRDPKMAPHGVYRSKDEDYWVALVIQNDEEWQRFREVVANPDWSNEERFRTAKDRLENQDELDEYVEGWTSQYNHYESAEILQSAGISADRKSTRLNSSHVSISYAVFCLKKKTLINSYNKHKNT